VREGEKDDKEFSTMRRDTVRFDLMNYCLRKS